MAWSDAARRAAAEARKMHAGFRNTFKNARAFNISADTSKEGRASLAHRLKQFRKPSMYKGGRHSDAGMAEAMSNATASTRLRNIQRLMKKGKK